MSRSKRYAYISLAESTACEAAFQRMEAAWQSGDVEQIAQALAGLKDQFIYSTYPWYDRWNELKPQVVHVLWHGWSRERFWKFEGNKNIHLWEFRSALEPLANELSEDDLKELCQKCGFPTARMHPQLWARLIGEPGDEFSRWLISKAEIELSSEERLKAAKTHAPKTPFGVFHWQPWKSEVAAPVEILARRHDETAHKQIRQWVRELPFASDRASVEALLRGVLDNRYSELERDVEAALERFSSPTELRLFLIEWFAQLNLAAALARFFTDLRTPMSEDARESYLDLFEGQLPKWKTQNENGLRHEVASVTCRGWSAFMRGYWAYMLEQNALPIMCRVGFGARLIDKTVRLFDATRPHVWGGCLMGWPLFLAIGVVIQIVLTLMWGNPPKQWLPVNLALTIVWATCVATTATFDIYHGGEARRARFVIALCSFGSFAAMLVFGVWSRVA